MARPKVPKQNPITAGKRLSPEEARALEEAQLDNEFEERMRALEHDELVRDREYQQAFKKIVDATGKRSPYSAGDKLRAALAYVITASSKKAEQKCGIPAATIREWKAKAPWWPQAMEYALLAKRQELDASLTQIQDLATGAIIDRLEHGDTRVDTMGRERKVPVSARDAINIFGIARDKQALMRGEEAKRKTGMSEEERIALLAKKITKAVTDAVGGKPIEGTVIKDDDN